MPDNNKLNVRNIYIDLLNKMKELDAVDQAYIDHLVALVRVDMGLMDDDIEAIEAVIPSGASASNKLVTSSSLPHIVSHDFEVLSDGFSQWGGSGLRISASIDIVISNLGDLTTKKVFISAGITTQYPGFPMIFSITADTVSVRLVRPSGVDISGNIYLLIYD